MKSYNIKKNRKIENYSHSKKKSTVMQIFQDYVFYSIVNLFTITFEKELL